MTNELLDAANGSDDSSEERYEKLKKEQAGTDMSQAERRYEQLKEEATQEFIREQRQKDNQDDEDENQEESSDDSDDSFVTY